jgi:TolA-binding protein
VKKFKLSFRTLSILILPALPGLIACQLQTREDVQKQEEQKQVREQISNMQKSKADVELKYSDIQNDIRVVAGRVDAIEHNQQGNQQSLKADNENLKKLVEAQNEKIKLLQAHIDATETRLTAAIQAIAGPAPVGKGAGYAGGDSDVGVAPVRSKEGGPFDEAESFFGAKEYKKAIVKFQNYIDKNPKGKNVAEATYKIGVCFAELGLKKDAKEFYKEVTDSYPSSSWAKKAKYRLSHLK